MATRRRRLTSQRSPWWAAWAALASLLVALAACGSATTIGPRSRAASELRRRRSSLTFDRSGPATTGTRSVTQRGAASHTAGPQTAGPTASQTAGPTASQTTGVHTVEAHPGSATPSAPTGWTFSVHHVTEGTYQRVYLVAQPTQVTAARLPVVVALHGRTMTPEMMVRESGLLGVVGQAVVVYPEGVERSWDAGYCCGAAQSLGVDDVSFIESVISQVLASVERTSVSDVYLVGYSNGGRMAYRMACADPGAFAGVAAVEAIPVSPCESARPVPLVVVGSTGDPIITIPDDLPPKHIEGHTEMTVDQAVSLWRSLDGCSAASATADLPGWDITSWSSCRGAGRVEFAEYLGGSHHWPVGSASAPSAQQVIWQFFEHQAPGSVHEDSHVGRSDRSGRIRADLSA